MMTLVIEKATATYHLLRDQKRKRRECGEWQCEFDKMKNKIKNN